MLREFPPDWQLVAGCDASELALSFCRERGLRSLVRCDVTQLPFASRSFDLVTVLDVVEHLERDDACLREIARVCRPQRHVLIHVPAFQILWSDKDELNHHYRRYQRKQLIDLVARCGLTVTQTFYVNSMLFPVALALAVVGRARHNRHADRPAPSADQLDRLYQIPAVLNRFMIGFMGLERRLTSRLPLPFGMSLVCVARKDEAC
jgi:SAM-dependent methyltransferase